MQDISMRTDNAQLGTPHAPSRAGGVSGEHPAKSPIEEADFLSRYADLRDEDLIETMVKTVFADHIAVASSFGAESAVLLSLVAQVAPETPVLFLDTGLLFAQTEQYRVTLQRHLGLRDVRVIAPDQSHLAEYDPNTTLSRTDPSLCCHFRKTLPLQRALCSFDAWITGRKAFQGGARSTMARIEHDGQHFKVNPLADWSPDRIEQRFQQLNLPRHPLLELGYRSIGCYPCTRAVLPGEDSRAGRWSGSEKTECGIHNAPFSGKDI